VTCLTIYLPQKKVCRRPLINIEVSGHATPTALHQSSGRRSGSSCDAVFQNWLFHIVSRCQAECCSLLALECSIWSIIPVLSYFAAWMIDPSSHKLCFNEIQGTCLPLRIAEKKYALIIEVFFRTLETGKPGADALL